MYVLRMCVFVFVCVHVHVCCVFARVKKAVPTSSK